MHILRSCTLPLLVLATAIAADPTPAPTPVPAIEVRARQITINQSLDYESDGAAKRTNVRTSLDLVLTPPAGMLVIGNNAPEVKEWVCDDGTVLTANSDRMNMMRGGSMRRFGNQGGSDPINVQVSSMQAPTGKAIARLTGSITLQVADGPVQEALLKPVKDMVGQPVEIEGQPGMVIEIESWNEREIAVAFPIALEGRLQGIELRGAGGERIESGGYSGSGDGTRMVRTMRVRVPADGAVAVRFIPKIKEVVVPFALTNLALPSAEAARKPVRKLATTPVEEPKVEKAPVKPVGGGGF